MTHTTTPDATPETNPHAFAGTITVTGAYPAISVKTDHCNTTPHGLGHALAAVVLTFQKDLGENPAKADLFAFHLGVIAGIRCGLARSETIKVQ